jgi:hypothetical protein
MSDATPGSSTPVDTAKLPARRVLHFDSLDEMLAEVDRLVEAERQERLKRLGNWRLGQTLGHLASWTEYGYDGYPPLRVPFFIRWMLRLLKRHLLYKPMRAGATIPGVPGGTLATDPVPLDEALARLRRVTERLKREAPPVPSWALGKLTHEESIAITLRHAELHLGFLLPQP